MSLDHLASAKSAKKERKRSHKRQQDGDGEDPLSLAKGPIFEKIREEDRSSETHLAHCRTIREPDPSPDGLGTIREVDPASNTTDSPSRRLRKATARSTSQTRVPLYISVSSHPMSDSPSRHHHHHHHGSHRMESPSAAKDSLLSHRKEKVVPTRARSSTTVTAVPLEIRVKKVKKDKDAASSSGSSKAKSGPADADMQSLESMMQVFSARLILEMRNSQMEMRQTLNAVMDSQRELAAQFSDRETMLQDVVKSQAQLVHLLSLFSCIPMTLQTDKPATGVEVLLAAKLSSMTEESNRMRQRLKETSEIITKLQDQVNKLS